MILTRRGHLHSSSKLPRIGQRALLMAAFLPCLLPSSGCGNGSSDDSASLTGGSSTGGSTTGGGSGDTGGSDSGDGDSGDGDSGGSDSGGSDSGGGTLGGSDSGGAIGGSSADGGANSGGSSGGDLGYDPEQCDEECSAGQCNDVYSNCSDNEACRDCLHFDQGCDELTVQQQSALENACSCATQNCRGFCGNSFCSHVELEE